MKIVDVADAEGKLSQLIAEAKNGNCIVLRDGDAKVALEPFIDPEIDSPELEAELLKAADGPFTPFTIEDLRAYSQELLRECRKK